jgi:triacylglycerol lipase
VNTQLPANCRIWLTGHSLGGALASLTAVRLGGRASGLYTFGAPRIGDAVFAARVGSLLKEASMRYVNDRDVVTHVPPEQFAHPHRYTHADHLRWIGPGGQVRTRPALSSMPDVFRPASSLLEAVNVSPEGLFDSLPDSLVDHTPLYYALHT